MTGWIIYSKEDVEKNRSFVQMFQEKFGEYHVDIKLIIAEEHKPDGVVPDFAINRSRFYDIARELEDDGIRVFNSSKVTKIANDKGKTYKYFKEIVPFLPVKYNNENIISGIESQQTEYPKVIKSCNGHGGTQVFMAENIMKESLAVQELKGASYIEQQVCSDLGKDVRVYIVGNKVVAAVLRCSENSFKSNYSLGGKTQIYKLNETEVDMVNKITNKLPIDFGGIDFTFHNGEAVFNEIEDAVGSRMLYASSDIDIVQIFVKYIVDTLGIRNSDV